MLIRVLGCSGSIAAGSRTTSFLVDDDILVDAGTGVGDLALEALLRIDHVLVTHSHLDHILAIGLLADCVTRLREAARRPPIVVHALPATIAALRRHVFNGVIWPDFTQLPRPEAAVMQFAPFQVGQVLHVGRRVVEVLPAEHTVPAVGFAVRADHADAPAWVFTGDTGPNPALWARLARLRVAALVIETAFSDEEDALAGISSHLNPRRLQAELAQIAGDMDVWITHIKPGEVKAVMSQIAALGSRHRIGALATGQTLEVAG